MRIKRCLFYRLISYIMSEVSTTQDLNKNDDKYVTINGKKYHKVDKLFKDEQVELPLSDLPPEDQENRVFVQKYALVSFLNPEKVRNTNVRGVMIRGVYPTEELAEQKANELRDKYFDVYLAPVGEWVVHNPDPDRHASKEAFAEDEKELNELMIQYKKNRDKSDQAESLRRKRIKEESVEDVIDQRKAKTLNRLKAKLREKEQANEVELAKQQLGDKHVDANVETVPDISVDDILPVNKNTNKKKKRANAEKRRKLAKRLEEEKVRMAKELNANNEESKTLKEMKELVKEEDELGNKEREQLKSEHEKLREEEQKVKTMKERIDKIKQLHEKMKSKISQN